MRVKRTSTSLERRLQLLRLAEVDQHELRPRQHHQVARVRVGVEEAVLHDHLGEREHEDLRDVRRVDAHALASPSESVILTPSMYSIVSTRRLV